MKEITTVGEKSKNMVICVILADVHLLFCHSQKLPKSLKRVSVWHRSWRTLKKRLQSWANIQFWNQCEFFGNQVTDSTQNRRWTSMRWIWKLSIIVYLICKIFKCSLLSLSNHQQRYPTSEGGWNHDDTPSKSFSEILIWLIW